MGVTRFPAQRKSRADSPALVHQFLIALSHVDPLVWRRIQVPQSYTFWDLHVAIQDAMGWEDRHLHEFRLFDDQSSKVIAIGLATDMMSPDRPVAPGWTIPLSLHFESPEWLVLPILYAYDFGDGWEHALIHEGTQTAKRSVTYPHCMSGAGSCPPRGLWRTSRLRRVAEDHRQPKASAIQVDDRMDRRSIRSRFFRSETSCLRQSKGALDESLPSMRRKSILSRELVQEFIGGDRSTF